MEDHNLPINFVRNTVMPGMEELVENLDFIIKRKEDDEGMRGGRKKKTRKKRAGKKMTRKKNPNPLRRTTLQVRERRRQQEQQENMIREAGARQFRRDIIEAGILSQTLIRFVSSLNRALETPEHQNVETYQRFLIYFQVMNQAIGDTTISEQDRSRLDLIRGLIMELFFVVHSDLVFDDGGYLSNSDSD